MAVEYGVIKTTCIDNVRRGAIRTLLDVEKYTANLALESLTGWTSSYNIRQTHMVRFWNGIQSMENDRLPKIPMDWDRKLAFEGRKAWNWHLREIMTVCDHTQVYDLELCLGLSFVKIKLDMLFDKAQHTWTNNCVTTSKLRTFYAICAPPPPLKADVIVTTPLLRSHICVVAKLMCRTSNLDIERGHHIKIPMENCFCILCQNMVVEEEVHFILKCPFYNDLRNPIFLLANLQYPNFTELTDLHLSIRGFVKNCIILSQWDVQQKVTMNVNLQLIVIKPY